MSEKDDKLNKGSFLYINDEEKAEWGVPNGYPWKELIEYGPCVEDDTIDHFNHLGTIYYKVSSDTPSAEELKSFHVYYPDGSKVIDSSVGDLPKYTDETVFHDRLMGFIAVCYKTEIKFNGNKTITVPSTGIYMADGEVSSFIIKSEKVYHIAAEFLSLATPTTAGTMKQAAAVADVTAAPTADEFNALLKSLRDAGILATS